ERRRRRIANESNRYRRNCIESLRRRALTVNVITLSTSKNYQRNSFIHCKIPLFIFRCPNSALRSKFSAPSALCFCCYSTDKKAPGNFVRRIMQALCYHVKVNLHCISIFESIE
ncbi:hypothetical protein SDJN02_23787, partial [Cucurbita argyrosperma subsp. argyrosperma]